MFMVPVLAGSAVGEVLPELKELPVSTKKPGLNHCRRLVVCRATPVYDNHLFQKGKYEKCIECAKKNPSEKIKFNSSKKGCGSKNRDVDAKECYECTVNSDNDKSKVNCTYSVNDCENVTMVLDLLDPPRHTPKFEKVYDSDGQDTLTTRLVSTTSEALFDRTEVCKQAHGTLCWFGKLPNGKYRGWNYKDGGNYQTYDLNDTATRGQGFPTKDVCLHYMAEDDPQSTPDSLDKKGTCVKGICEVSDKEASCSCDEFKDVAQFDNPCAFLEANCDEKSLAYTEAKLKIKQADVSVQDIVTVGDAERFLKDLDAVASKMP